MHTHTHMHMYTHTHAHTHTRTCTHTHTHTHTHAHTHTHTTHTHTQLADSFSLEHPTQFFIQSRGIREGGMVGPRDLKQEEEEPQAMAEAGTDFGDISELDLFGGFEEEMETI